MIETIENGDMFESGCDMIVCPVNVCKVMGKGLAKEFKERYPGIYLPYYEKCDKKWEIGTVLTFKNPSDEFPKWICLFPTKIHWKQSSQMWIIERGMAGLFDEIAYTGIKSIAIPALGCGLGTLNWEKVKDYLVSLPWPEFLNVKLYAPNESQLPQ